jgi:hypothetical protein
MIRHPGRRLPASGLLIVVLTTCAPASLQRGVLRHEVGRGSRGDIELTVPELLIRAGYAIQQRRDTGSLLYYETTWHSREPFEDEIDQCALGCRSRIIVEARRQGGNLYSVTLRAENAFLDRSLDPDPSMASVWVPFPPGERFREHVSELSAGIGMRIDAGVRVFRSP